MGCDRPRQLRSSVHALHCVWDCIRKDKGRVQKFSSKGSLSPGVVTSAQRGGRRSRREMVKEDPELLPVPRPAGSGEWDRQVTCGTRVGRGQTPCSQQHPRDQQRRTGARGRKSESVRDGG